MIVISLQVLGVSIDVHCANSNIQHLLVSNFGGLQPQDCRSSVLAEIEYSVVPDGPDTFAISRSGKAFISNADSYDLIYFLEKDITVKLQKIRKELLFLHGAALEYNNKACLIVAPSGSGKSTTTWALLHHGFRYLSDELSPIELSTMKVSAYPHALCLKKDPPSDYSLPKDVLRTVATIHVPIEYLPAEVCWAATPLKAIFFLKYIADQAEPSIHSITPGEASARLYSNALNPLAHPDMGLDVCIDIAKSSQCYYVVSSDLSKTAQLLTTTMDKI